MNFIKIIALVFCLSAISAYTQNDSEAASLLESISNKYKSFNTSKIEAKLIIDIPDSDQNINKNVSVWLKKNKFKIEFDTKIMMSNTITQWTFLKEENELQISNYDESSIVFTPSKILNVYSDDYIYRIKEEYKDTKGQLIKKIELTPKNKEMEIFKIVVSVHVNSKEIIETKMFEKSGFKYSYKIISLKQNIKLQDSFFEFDKTKYNIDEDDITDLR